MSFYPQNLPIFVVENQVEQILPLSMQTFSPRPFVSFAKILAGKPQEVIEAWYEILGKKYNGMTQAIGLKDGILSIKVRNASLYAVLKQSSQKS